VAVWAPLAEPAQHALIIGKPRTPIKPNDLYDHHATIPRKMRFMAGQLCANRRWRGPALESSSSTVSGLWLLGPIDVLRSE
jgi:hypothetical protein